MDWPEDTFVECPYWIEIRPRTAAHHLLYLHFPSGAVKALFATPDILTRHAIFEFIDDIRQYGRGELQLTSETALLYDRNLAGLSVYYNLTNHRTMMVPFCKELFDVLVEIAG